MKNSRFLPILALVLTSQTVLAELASTDSQIAKCGAAISVMRDEARNKLFLDITNQNCRAIEIDTAMIKKSESLRSNGATRIDVSAFKGAKIPVKIDDEFLILQIETGVKIELTDAQKRIQAAQLREAARRDAEAAAAGIAAAAGVANVILDEVGSSEH